VRVLKTPAWGLVQVVIHRETFLTWQCLVLTFIFFILSFRTFIFGALDFPHYLHHHIQTDEFSARVFRNVGIGEKANLNVIEI